MEFVGIVLAIAIIGAMVYLALNKKSNFHTRLAALIALAVMILTVIICLIIALSDTRAPVDVSTLIVGAPVEVVEQNNNLLSLFFLIIFLLAFLVLIAVLAMREQRKNKR
jgi:formate hydrogenlyase subunit 3/multisubunit Na+/H+ antiporter MnhD subunit